MSQHTHFTFNLSVRARLVAFFLFVAVMIPLQAAASERGKSPGNALRVNPYEFGEWAVVTPSPAPSVVAIHTNVLPDGRVLFWGANFAGQTTAQIWHPTNNTLMNANHTGASLFCGGHAFLPDGRLLVTGGQTTLFAGIPNTTFFDFSNTNNPWSYNAANDMNAGRWYPSNVSLGNGELLVAAGTYCREFGLGGSCTRWANNPLPQVWQTTGGWRNLYGANLELTTYPWMYLTSNGKVFLAGPLRYTGFLNTSGIGAWEGPNPLSQVEWRESGSSVMYDVDKILIVGGNNPPANSAEVIDLRAANPAWRVVDHMTYSRRHHNATILADGKVLVTGGTGGSDNDPCSAVYAAEMWDPDPKNEKWSEKASMSIRRLYHSTAVLLPDGRVLTGGTTSQPATGCKPAPNETQLEVYSPPYLFNADGSRATPPYISYAPTDVTYDQSFFVGVAGVTAISKVTLIKLPSVTHSFDQSQRINSLSFRRVSGGMRVTAPANGNVCPPGHYMMFILNDVGVPSVARIIHVS